LKITWALNAQHRSVSRNKPYGKH